MTVEVVLAFTRHLLTLLGGVLVSKGLLTTGMADTLIGGVLSIAGVIWSLIQKKQQGEQVAVALATPPTGGAQPASPPTPTAPTPTVPSR